VRLKKIKTSQKQRKTLAFKGWGDLSFCGELSFTLSFLLFLFYSASTVSAYIFTAPNFKATIINLEPCALNADFLAFHPQI